MSPNPSHARCATLRRAARLENESVLAALVCAALAWAASGCQPAPAKTAPAPGSAAFVVTSPVRMDVPDRREYVAEIQGVRHVELRARVVGFVKEILVDEGMPVQEGQVLFRLETQVLAAELARAEARAKGAAAEVGLAEIELRNRTTLLEKGIISEPELDAARAKLAAVQAGLDEARADVTDAELRLGYSEVRAPFTGTINRIPNKVGSLVNEGDLLTTLTDNGEVFAYFKVSEPEYLELARRRRIGSEDSVALQLVDGSLYPNSGRIETWDTVISRSTGAIACRVRFANPERLLLHGATGKVVLESRIEQALVIPQRSTFEVQQKLCVFVLEESGKVALRSVTPGLRLSNHFAIAAGLAATDRILFEGVQVVREGEAIVAEFKPLSELAQLQL
jgi:membrane fusion protein (multidrug efflux system)